MRIEVLLPKWGMTMQEGTLVEWHAGVGDRVTTGDPLATVETEKVDTDLPAPGTGMLAEILVPAGATVPVGTILAYINAD